MEINFSFTVLCDKDHLKKLQHLLIDEEYDGILDAISSESEYEIQDFKGEVVDPDKKNNTITIPYKQNDNTITIPNIIPCTGTAPLNLNDCIDHLYRPGQVVYEPCTEPAENVVKLYGDESDIYSAEGSSDLPDDVDFSSTPNDFSNTNNDISENNLVAKYKSFIISKRKLRSFVFWKKPDESLESYDNVWQEEIKNATKYKTLSDALIDFGTTYNGCVKVVESVYKSIDDIELGKFLERDDVDYFVFEYTFAPPAIKKITGIHLIKEV